MNFQSMHHNMVVLWNELKAKNIGQRELSKRFEFAMYDDCCRDADSRERFRNAIKASGLKCMVDSILKSRDISLPTKVRLVKAMVFPVVMYGCESWTVKKAECQRIDAFELWCWRRLLRVPWTARRSNQSILKEISPEISLEGMMLKLKPSTLATSCEELTHWKRL